MSTTTHHLKAIMKPYKHIRLKQGTKEWEQWRNDSGLGGSDVSSALATSSQELAKQVYMAPIQLHLLKIGEPVTRFSGNISSSEGHFQEAAIIERLKYYDLESTEQMTIYRNMAAGIKLNGIYQPKNVLVNPKYHWLFYSMDAFLTESVKSKKPLALVETKLTTSMETNRYENKTNPAHWVQLMTGLMITGFPYGYLVSLVDGKFFNVLKVVPDKEVFEWIEVTTAKFWQNVTRAKKVKLEYGIPAYYNVTHFTEKQQEGVRLLQQLEPSLTGTDHELDFIKEQIVTTAEEIPREGTQEEFEAVVKYLKAKAHIDAAQAAKNIYYETMISLLNGCNVIKFNDGVDGYYSYKANKKGVASLHISPKIKSL